MGRRDHPTSERAKEKERARDADLAAIARGEMIAAEVNRKNALGAQIADLFRPTFRFGVPSMRRKDHW